VAEKSSNIIAKRNLGEVLRLNPYRLNAILYGVLSSVVNKPATAIMCCDHNSPATKFAAKAGFDLMQFASMSLLKRHGFWLWEQSQSFAYQPNLLNDRLLKSVVKPRVEAGFGQLAHPQQHIEQIVIDNHLAGLKEVSWIHCAYPEVINILSGARKRILTDQPVITLSAEAAHASACQLQSLMDDLAYCLYDCNLNLVDATEQAESGDMMLIALPAKSLLHAALVAILDLKQNFAAINDSGLVAEEVKRYYLSLVSKHFRSNLLLRTYLFSDNHVLNLSEHCSDGLYPPESDGEETWQWTGPGKQTKVQLCIPAPGQYFFRLYTGYLPANQQQKIIAIFMDGVNVFWGNIEPEQVIEFAVNYSNKMITEHAVLSIAVDELTNVDSKQLGICIRKIELYFPIEEML
jgi:hypothetical protein